MKSHVFWAVMIGVTSLLASPAFASLILTPSVDSDLFDTNFDGSVNFVNDGFSAVQASIKVNGEFRAVRIWDEFDRRASCQNGVTGGTSYVKPRKRSATAANSGSIVSCWME